VRIYFTPAFSLQTLPRKEFKKELLECDIIIYDNLRRSEEAAWAIEGVCKAVQ
jgi:hypothetical protein